MAPSSERKLVTLIPGDGIGPEVIGSARQIIEATDAAISFEEQQAGERVFKEGIASGVPQETIDSIAKTRVVLKGPLGTPVGYGEKSANVTLRKLFETYGNIRPVRELPGVQTRYSGAGIDLVIVRENVEDLYAGIEHMQTPGVAQTLKVISRKGCEKIVRLAFEFARAEGRQSVACATKANIMKMSEGMLKRTFEEIAPEYPEIESWHVIVDNCAHQLVRNPAQFDVIVTTNMNGDILSDLTSGLVGGLGFAPSANLGSDFAIFEAVHGSAPKHAGKNEINPTAVILSSVMMLRYLGEFEAASNIEHAVLVTLEEGNLTGDVVGYDKGISTSAYTDAIISNLGALSQRWSIRDYKPIKFWEFSSDPVWVRAGDRRVVGADVFVEFDGGPEELGKDLDEVFAGTPFAMKIIASRGTKVYPPTGTVTDCIDAYQCRIIARDENADLSQDDVLKIVQLVSSVHQFSHVEKLQEFDGQPGYTKSQGED